MPKYSHLLKIENRVKNVPSVELMRMLGASSSREDERKIGQFGSGLVYSLALFAREGILDDCKFCLGEDVYTFTTEGHDVKDSSGRSLTKFEIIMRKQGGATTNLNICTDFGGVDWDDITFGVRELISNACDGAESFDGSYKSVVLDPSIPTEGKFSRRKEGYIRVYVPLTEEIADYIEHAKEKHFICLRETYNAARQVLPNTHGGSARVYRKGVLVGQFGESSLFDYNINDLHLRESRVVDSYEAKEKCASALYKCGNEKNIRAFLKQVVVERKEDLWEHGFGTFEFQPRYQTFERGENQKEIESSWENAVKSVFGDRVLCSNATIERMVQAKGRPTVCVSSSHENMLKSARIICAWDVLNKHEMEGKETYEPTKTVLDTVTAVWDNLLSLDMTLGKEKPKVSCFRQHTTAEGSAFGYHEDGTIYIREDISEDPGLMLFQTVLEEIGHYITGAYDCTRDFQEFAFKAAAKALLSRRNNSDQQDI